MIFSSRPHKYTKCIFFFFTFCVFIHVFVRRALNCGSPIEWPYYTSPKVGLPDICVHFGEGGASRPQELVTQFKVVLPFCDKCAEAGKKALTARPRPTQATVVV